MLFTNHFVFVKHYYYKNRMIGSTIWLLGIELEPAEKNCCQQDT